MNGSMISENVIAIVQDHAFKLIESVLPQAKNYIEMIDDDDPTIGYIGDGFMEDIEVKDLNLPEKLEDDFIIVYDFEKYIDPDFRVDPNEPDIKENPCLKFKIKLKEVNT